MLYFVAKIFKIKFNEERLMSIYALIQYPHHIEEQSFGFPIATENVYNQYWLKFAIKNNLLWLKILNGIEIEKCYFDEIKDELLIFQGFLKQNNDPYYTDCQPYLLSRVELFIVKLDELKLVGDDLILWIG